MKKTISVILCVLLLSACTCALAEEGFQLRNGIMFGDTIDDIVAKETTLVREGEDSNSFEGSVAGYDGVECTFGFDDDGKLKQMSYWFNDTICSDRDKMDTVYDTISASMNRKYGTPLGNTGGTVHIITGPAMTSAALWVYLLGAMDGCDGDFVDYDEWIVDEEDYHVKIDLISYYYRDSSYNYQYYVSASYMKFTDEDLEAAVTQKQEQQDAVDNDF